MNPPSTLFGLWRHSFEEDAAGVRVYRPAARDFPRARGRAGLELKPDGTFVELGIGRGDKSVASTGTWSVQNDGSLSLVYADTQRGARRLEILEHEAEVLKLKDSP
ncbi:MAG TPA: hypothetical protein VNN80_25675 [Polyangiaceae bacterium]|jgi:hypothetical protein|nr:hypothetical protein [Polyangiaceae bacterium]